MPTNRIRDIISSSHSKPPLTPAEVLKFLESDSPPYAGAKKIEVTIEHHQHQHNYYILNPQPTESARYMVAPAGMSTTHAQDRTNAEITAWRNEMAHFERIKAKLWKDRQYRHKYVAIRQRTILDVDDDKFRLAKRVKQQFADEVVFIGQVQISARVVELPSPEIGP